MTRQRDDVIQLGAVWKAKAPQLFRCWNSAQLALPFVTRKHLERIDILRITSLFDGLTLQFGYIQMNTLGSFDTTI